MKDVAGIITMFIPIACGCILPMFAIWMGVRQKMNETSSRTKIVLAAIEKNPDMDIEEFLRKVAPKQKLLKEKLLKKLMWACLTAMLGLGLIGYGIYLGCNKIGGTHDPAGILIAGLSLLGVGIAFFINYRVGKSMLAKEMEAEEKARIAEADRK